PIITALRFFLYIVHKPYFTFVKHIEGRSKTRLLADRTINHLFRPHLVQQDETFWNVQIETGSAYYDNVRPLSYPDADAVLICFDISRPDTLDSVLKKWKGEIQEFCPNTKMLLVGCKSDLRTDLFTKSNSGHTPVSYDQGSNMAKQISAPYIECSSLQSENSVRDIFHVATLACVNKSNKNVKCNKPSRSTKRISHSRPDLPTVVSDFQKTKAKTCAVM
uniref:Uncharacterized protein n=1 Tax=Oncorhynchus tshawytscha TaxID=74940 RepID=A0AAZ3P9H8_ONCTS